MELWKLEPGKPATPMAADERLPEQGFAWLDLAYEEVDAGHAEIERLTGVRILDVHLGDAKNPAHPSSFDNTDTYEIVVFRGLSPNTTVDEIVTRPMTFFNFDKLLVTVRARDSRSCAQVKARFVNLPGKSPQSPDDLMQRLISAMVDHYLELRHPLAQRLDDWQQLLLDPRKPFHDWAKLLASRREIRQLQNLSEEQRDAIQEWHDYRIADLSPAMHARFADIVEHIERVLRHARTVEHQAESAVQLYFAAMSHRTTDIMRLLTLITAIFMPLTLITGIYGMNFDVIPGLHKPYGFWIAMAAMVGVVVAMLAYFRHRRWF
ncbi:MAG: magnesium transporter CorA family protein [Betaproteobacteria bacterium]